MIRRFDGKSCRCPRSPSVLRSLGVRRRRSPAALAPSVWELFTRYSWPGNVRELENIMKRIAALHSGEREIGAGEVLPFLVDNAPALTGPVADRAVAERDAILLAWRDANGNKSRLAGLLGISRKTLYARLKRLQLQL